MAGEFRRRKGTIYTPPHRKLTSKAVKGGRVHLSNNTIALWTDEGDNVIHTKDGLVFCAHL